MKNYPVDKNGDILVLYVLPLFSDILKVYNPDVTGYSKGWGPVWIESVSHLNVADPGDKSE